jgi:alpha-N-acetylglucosaminidase
MTQNQKSDENALGGGPNANKTSQELFDMALPHGPQIDWYAIEEPWTRQHNTYNSKTEGNSIDIAKEVIDFLK